MKTLPRILVTNRSLICFLLFVFGFTVFASLSGITFTKSLFAREECYIKVSSEQLLKGACGPIQTSGPCAGQYQCTGTRQLDGGEVCTACVASPGEEKLSCSRDTGPPNYTSCESMGYTIDEVSCPNDGQQASGCTGIYSDGCRYCVTPVCDPGETPFRGDCVPAITCEVNSASGTGTTTGEVSSRISAGSPGSYYTTVEWALINQNDNSRSVAGYTQMNPDGTASNNFTNLQSSTTYTVVATYQGSSAPNVECSRKDFTTWTPGQPPAQTTCSLSASPQTIDSGGSATWTLSNSPSGAQAVMKGTNPDGSQFNDDLGASPGYTGYTGTSWSSDSQIYNTQGSYQRYVQIKDSSGTVQCTTDTVQLYVNPQSCLNNPVSVSPNPINLSVGGLAQRAVASGTRGTVDWSSANSSFASVNPTLGTSTNVSPVAAGSTTVTAADSRTGGVTCRASASVSVTGGTGCPGQINACGDSNYGGLTPSSTSLTGCDGQGGTWTYPGTETYDEWCDSQKGLAADKEGYYCYQCNPGTGTGGPTPTPTTIVGSFSPSGYSVTGPLLVGRMLEDFNANFKIDEGIDTLVSKLTSLVSGTLRTLSGTNTLTGTFMNVLGHVSAVYKMTTSLGSSVANQTVSYTGSSGASSNFIKVAGFSKCTYTYSGQTYNDPTCNTQVRSVGSHSDRDFRRPSTPFEGVSQYETYYWEYNSDVWKTNWYRRIFSHTLSNTESGSCGSGCTVASKITFDDATAEGLDNCLVGGTFPQPECTGNTCTFRDYTYYQWSSNQAPYSITSYTDCTKKTFNKNKTSTSPWSVSFTSPTIVSAGSVTVDNWFGLFDVVDPGGCIHFPGTVSEVVNPTNPYCSCKLWSTGSSTSATFDCTYPLKSGQTLGGAPPGDYIFSITASTTGQIHYKVTAGSATLAEGDQNPANGTLTFNFTVPDSSIGQNINVELSQKGGGYQEVTFGAPGLYPKGWYEANTAIGLGREAYLKGRVIDPPEDYPYTIGRVPPAGNYCSKTSNVEQCYLSLSESPLSYLKVNQVDFLLGNIKAGGWFQVKDADLQAVGSLVSNIPSSCKSPKCTPQFELVGPGGFPGIPAYTTTSSFSSGTVSTKGWLAKSGYSGKRYDYAYFRSLANSSGRAIDLRTAGKGSLSGDILTLGNNDLSDLAGSDQANFVVFDGRLVLADGSGIMNLERKKLVLLAGGDVLIQSRLNLSDGEGFFGLFSGGSIIIDPAVKSENPNQYGLKGVFLADGAINTGTNNPVPGSGTADSQLYIRGMLAAWQGVQLQRDLDPARSTGANNDKPAEFIEYAPDLVLNFPKELLRQGSVWREIAP